MPQSKQLQYVKLTVVSRQEGGLRHRILQSALETYHEFETTDKRSGDVHTRFVKDEEFRRVEEHCASLGITSISLTQAMRIISGGRSDYFSDIKISERKKISVSRGFLVMLVNALIQDDVLKLKLGTADAISHLFETDSNSDPARQQRRDRGEAKRHIMGLLDRLSRDRHHNRQSLSSVLFAEIANYVKWALDKLQHVKSRLSKIHSSHIVGCIRGALTKPATSIVKLISNKICGHFYPEFCPQ